MAHQTFGTTDGVLFILFYVFCELFPAALMLKYLHRKPPPMLVMRSTHGINSTSDGGFATTDSLAQNLDSTITDRLRSGDALVPPWYPSGNALGMGDDPASDGFSDNLGGHSISGLVGFSSPADATPGERDGGGGGHMRRALLASFDTTSSPASAPGTDGTASSYYGDGEGSYVAPLPSSPLRSSYPNMKAYGLGNPDEGRATPRELSNQSNGSQRHRR